MNNPSDCLGVWKVVQVDGDDHEATQARRDVTAVMKILVAAFKIRTAESFGNTTELTLAEAELRATIQGVQDSGVPSEVIEAALDASRTGSDVYRRFRPSPEY